MLMPSITNEDTKHLILFMRAFKNKYGHNFGLPLSLICHD